MPTTLQWSQGGWREANLPAHPPVGYRRAGQELVRIIGGKAHGRRVAAPRGLVTRPATARARQSIFSRLEVRLDFAKTRVLDLFAGSGALGIEALSRGAVQAVFVDSSHAATAAIERNLEGLAMRERAIVLKRDVYRALNDLASQALRFDLVFIDAPYRNDLSAQVLERLSQHELVACGGWVVVRQYRRAAPLESPAPFERASAATIGDHRITLLRRKAAPNDSSAQ